MSEQTRITNSARLAIAVLAALSLASCAQRDEITAGNDTATMIAAAMPDTLDRSPEERLEQIAGFWDVAGINAAQAQYNVIGSDGQTLNYQQDPVGRNCFIVSGGIFTPLGGQQYLIETESSEQELTMARTDNELFVADDIGDFEVWTLAEGISPTDLQICT